MLTDPACFVNLCKEDLAKYAAGRKQEVDKGRETPEFAALLVQKYGYGMMQAMELLFKLEQCDEKSFINYVEHIDSAVASINPEWEATDRRRWAARRVGIEFTDAPPWMISSAGGRRIPRQGGHCHYRDDRISSCDRATTQTMKTKPKKTNAAPI